MGEHGVGDEQVDVDELDVEAFTKENEAAEKPRARVYVLRVDRETVRVEKPIVTGAEILDLVGKTPVTHKLFQKVRRKDPVPVNPEETVNLRAPGIERFQTIPMDTTEGSDGLRRQFDLPENDIEYLNERSLQWEAVVEGRTFWLLIHEYPVPKGYAHRRTSAALHIPSTYPDVQIDMVYFFPHLTREDGRAIGRLSNRTIDGKSWQRWSRHRTSQNPWRREYDCLETHLLLVDEWLEREGRRAA